MKHLSIVIVLLLILIPMEVYADDLPRALVIHNGVPGYWFNEETGNKILSDLEELNIDKQKLELLNTKLELKDETIAILKMDMQLSDEIGEKYKKMYELQLDVTNEYVDLYEKCLKKEDKWYRNPVFWAIIGFIIGAGATIGISYSLPGAN